MGTEPSEEQIRRNLLNGRRPKERKQPYRSEPSWTQVTDPDLLEPYERVLYDDDPSLTKEELTARMFHWSEQFSYEELVAWFAAGADYDSHWACVELKRLGVPPEVAARHLTHRGEDTGQTVLGAVLTQRIPPESVKAMIDRREAS